MLAIRDENSPRQVKEVVNSIVKQFDNYGVVTLQNNATTTVVEAGKVNSKSMVLLQPMNDVAALVWPLAYVSSVGNRTFTITHPSATTVRQYGYVIFGV